MVKYSVEDKDLILIRRLLNAAAGYLLDEEVKIQFYKDLYSSEDFYEASNLITEILEGNSSRGTSDATGFVV